MRPLFYAVALALACLVGPGGGSGSGASSEGKKQRVDALCAEGTVLLEQERPGEAMVRFLSAIEQNPKHAPSYVGLGHAYLSQDSLKAAEDAFRDALRKKKRHPPALNGLGLVFQRTPKGRQWAIKYFRKAYQADKTYEEAYCNLAQTYCDVGDTRELDAYMKLLKVSPEHPDAWFQVGRIHQDGIGTHYKDQRKSEGAYRKQLGINQRHIGARYRLGLVLMEAGQREEGLELLQTAAETPGRYQREGLLALAEAYQEGREHERSELLLDAYVERLEPDEQELYYDLSLVAAGEELRKFRDSPRDQWELLSERFWASRDPAPVTAANERRIEHRRRVAYARENFGKHKFPWDARGEVYVRYGQPDHVSSSGDIRFETEPAVVAVKERLVNQAGEAAGLLALNQRMVNKYGDEVGLDDRTAPASLLGIPVYPLPAPIVWEYWVYTDVGQGVEAVFTQKYQPGPHKHVRMAGPGDVEYMDPVTGTKWGGRAKLGDGLSDQSWNSEGIAGDRSARFARIWRGLHPATVIQRLASKTPQVYRPDFATGPLDFYFDSARFRGTEANTDMEVYYGIPIRDLDFVAGVDGRSTARIKRGIAIYDVDGRRAHRTSEDMVYTSEVGVDSTQLAFLPELDRIALLPGTYRLSVQILDTSSGKSQVYNQQITLDPFGHEGLRISDIQLAASIKQAAEGKFLKGDIDVVPNPSRGYLPGQPVFIYYEIYNLKQDEFGATRYRVSYELRSLESRSVGARVLGGLGRLLGQRQEAETIVIEYEHVGDESSDYRYLQLDMSDTEPGDQILEVRVTDENAGSVVVASSTFTLRAATASGR